MAGVADGIEKTEAIAGTSRESDVLEPDPGAQSNERHARR